MNAYLILLLVMAGLLLWRLRAALLTKRWVTAGHLAILFSFSAVLTWFAFEVAITSSACGAFLRECGACSNPVPAAYSVGALVSFLGGIGLLVYAR
jgi:hypothetical protein